MYDELLDRILHYTEFEENGHMACKLAEVRMGTGKVRTALAYWRIKNGPVPDTHKLVNTCGRADCIALEHNQLESRKKKQNAQKEIAFQLQSLRRQNGALRARNDALQTENAALAQRNAELEAALFEPESARSQ